MPSHSRFSRHHARRTKWFHPSCSRLDPLRTRIQIGSADEKKLTKRGLLARRAAADCGNETGIIDALRAGARVNGKNNRSGGLTALHLASGRGHAGCIMLLLGEGSDVHAQTHLGRTPLHVVADSQEAVEVLGPRLDHFAQPFDHFALLQGTCDGARAPFDHFALTISPDHFAL